MNILTNIFKFIKIHLKNLKYSLMFKKFIQILFLIIIFHSSVNANEHYNGGYFSIGLGKTIDTGGMGKFVFDLKKQYDREYLFFSDVELDYGYFGSAGISYIFLSNFEIEAELLYGFHNHFDSMDKNINFTNHYLSSALKLIYNINFSDQINAFIGIGAGFSIEKMDIDRLLSNPINNGRLKCLSLFEIGSTFKINESMRIGASYSIKLNLGVDDDHSEGLYSKSTINVGSLFSVSDNIELFLKFKI